MKKTEKLLSAIALLALGGLFILLKANFISILMTVVGTCLIAMGIVDLVNRAFPPSVVKIVAGVLVIVAGWAIVEAVLYILSALLLIFGTLWLYDVIKAKRSCGVFWRTAMEYVQPVICIAVGILLLFNRSEFIDFIFIVNGILTIIEGGLLLAEAVTED